MTADGMGIDPAVEKLLSDADQTLEVIAQFYALHPDRSVDTDGPYDPVHHGEHVSLVRSTGPAGLPGRWYRVPTPTNEPS